MQSSPPPLLAALLTSVVGDLARAGSIADLTADQITSPWIPAEARTEELAALVVCELSDLHRARDRRRPHGMILARAPRGSTPDSPRVTSAHFELVTSVRDGDHTWHLLVDPGEPPELGHRAQPDPLEASVVLVTRDQARALYRFLTMLSVEPRTTRWEVIVADRGSFDETADLLRAVEGDIRVLDLPRDTGAGEALHRALELARAPLLIVADVDYIPAPAFVQAAVRDAMAAPIDTWFAGPRQLDDRPARLFALRRSAWVPTDAPRDLLEFVAHLHRLGPPRPVRGLVSRPPRT